MWLWASAALLTFMGCAWYWLRESDLKDSPTHLHSDYFRGLNYLINEQPDKAVDVFIRLLEVDSDTVEMHLAIGNLFRQRGEVDRAIRIHQNLIARPNLSHAHHLEALATLGEDYFRAGVLDRAEKLFQQLVSKDACHEGALQFLLIIYQREKEWLKAVEIAKQLVSLGNESMETVIAQFYCELAEQAHEPGKGFNKEVKNYLKRAEQADKHCARASMIKGACAFEEANYELALFHFRSVEFKDAIYLSEVIQSIVQCYEKLQDNKGLETFLTLCLEKFPSDAVVFAISHYLQQTKDSIVAIDFLTEQIKHTPSLRGLTHLIDLYIGNSSGDTQEKLFILQGLITTYTKNKPLYQCAQCGFSAQFFTWSCPGCHKWVTIKPIQGLR